MVDAEIPCTRLSHNNPGCRCLRCVYMRQHDKQVERQRKAALARTIRPSLIYAPETLTPLERERAQVDRLEAWQRLTPAEKQQRRFAARRQSRMTNGERGSADVLPTGVA